MSEYVSSMLEIDFPIESVSEASAKEKSIRHGHISTLQQWWARRPLAVCRSTIFAALCPSVEKVKKSEEVCALLDSVVPGDLSTFDKLMNFTGLLADWKSADNKDVLSLARRLISLEHSVPPVMLDSFAGGGSFPLEGLRLGLNVFAGELNPVAATALKVAIEYLPMNGEEILSEYLACTEQVARRLDLASNSLYSSDDEGLPLAFFWCRTYCCPQCQTEVPLLRNYWLEKGKRNQAIKLVLSKTSKRFGFFCFQPSSAGEKKDVSRGTVSNGGAVCPNCKNKVPTSWLRKIGQDNKLGDRLYAKLLITKEGDRIYKNISPEDESKASFVTFRNFEDRRLYEVPSQPFDLNGIRHTWAVQYGIKKYFRHLSSSTKGSIVRSIL